MGDDSLTGRVRRRFEYTNEDGQEGAVEVSFGPYGGEMRAEAVIMLVFDDACWMGTDKFEEFQRWLKMALAEARRRHIPLVIQEVKHGSEDDKVL